MLKGADGDNSVELDVGFVVQPVLRTHFHTWVLLGPDESRLLITERETDRPLNAAALRQPLQDRTPPTADVEHGRGTISPNRVQVKLQLPLLGGFECVVGAFPHRTRIGERLVEPKTVERVPGIVVMPDGSRRTGGTVAFE